MKLSYRITRDGNFSYGCFDELLELFKRYPDSIDEVSVFEQNEVQGYHPMSVIEDYCRVLEKRLGQLRAAGIKSVGINSLITLGHADDSEMVPAPSFGTMVGPGGERSRGCMCPNDVDFLSYIAEKYRRIALCGPDFVWVDDDIRMENHGIVRHACFCPTCLSRFSADFGYNLTREELVKKLNAPDGEAIRHAWAAHNGATLTRLMKTIGDAVHNVDPKIETGLMYYEVSPYNGMDHKRLVNALGGVRVRPGGGFYEDEHPGSFLLKMYSIERQISNLPEGLTDIQYEQENYPYQRLQKSTHMLALECTAALVSGMNGLAVNALHSDKATNAEIAEKCSAMYPVWKEITKVGGNTQGLYGAWTAETAFQYNGGNWFETVDRWLDTPYALSFPNAGIPLTMRKDDNCATLLAGHTAAGLSDSELTEILSGGVFLDAASLEILQARGLGHLCGAQIKDKYNFNVFEVFTDDPFNENEAGRINNKTGLIPPGSFCYTFLPSDGARVISNLCGPSNLLLGASLIAYENSLGGRVIVGGYLPWQNLLSPAKLFQTRNLCDWLSFGKMPVLVHGAVRVIPMIRVGDGFALLLINAFLDPTGPFEVDVRLPVTEVERIEPHGKRTPVPCSPIQGGMRLHVDRMEPWEFTVLIGK